VEFGSDPEKAAANVAQRGISFAEASTVLEDPPSITFPDEASSEGEMRFLTIGTSHRGRLLVVAYTEGPDTTRIINARQARGANKNSMSKTTRPEDDESQT
jgi:uncharacterized protein